MISEQRIYLLTVGFFLVLISPVFTDSSKTFAQNKIRQRFSIGEKISYKIKKLGISVGTATIEYKGPAQINGQACSLIIVTAEALNFYDEEKIYFNPQTYYPVMIERDLDLWGKIEKIQERYSYQEGRGKVDIIKTEGKKKTELTIEKKSPLDNIYTFIYRYREQGDFRTGEEMAMFLPTKDIHIALKQKDSIKINGEKQEAFYLESRPKQYRLWLSTDDKRIPVRIDGAVGFGNTSMILDEYSPGSDKNQR